MPLRGSSGSSPNVSAATGVLPITNGGTNSNTALGNNAWLSSQSGSIKEQSGIYLVQPSAGDTGIQAALDAANTAGGGIVQLFPGTYTIATGINCTGYNNVILQGCGDATLLSVGNVTPNSGVGIRFRAAQVTSNVEAQAIADVSASATSITLSTHGRAGDWKAGDLVCIRGTDGNSLPEVVINKVAADGNATSGVVTLLWPVAKALSSCTASAGTGSRNNKIKDMKFTIANALQDMCAVQFAGGESNTVENCTFTNANDSSAGDIQVLQYNTASGFQHKIKNCKFIDGLSTSVTFKGVSDCVIEDSLFINGCTGGGSTAFVSIRDFTRDTTVRNNQFVRSGAYCIQFAVDTARRIYILENTFTHSANYAIQGTQSEIIVKHNIFENIATYPILCQSGINMNVSDNSFLKCAGGIVLQATGQAHQIVSNNHFAYLTAEAITCNGGFSSIVGNNLYGFSGDGIYSKGERIIISNNVIDNWSSGTYAIHLDDAFTYGVCSGNVLKNGGSNGLSVHNNSDFNVFVGNMLANVTVDIGTATHNTFIGNQE